MPSENLILSDRNDLIAIVGKSVLGQVPYIGAFLGELIGTLVPNQRIDRIARFVKELDDKLSNIKAEVLSALKNDDNFIDLLEEAFIQASRATSNERREYIASIVINGISDDTLEIHESKYLFGILKELSDIEILWLRYFLVPTMGGDQEFRSKHENIFRPILPTSDDENIRKAAIQKSYKEHLERLELIQRQIRLDRNTGVPEYERNGHPKTGGTFITSLGRLLLLQIGLIEDFNEG